MALGSPLGTSAIKAPPRRSPPSCSGFICACARWRACRRTGRGRCARGRCRHHALRQPPLPPEMNKSGLTIEQTMGNHCILMMITCRWLAPPCWPSTSSKAMLSGHPKRDRTIPFRQTRLAFELTHQKAQIGH